MPGILWRKWTSQITTSTPVPAIRRNLRISKSSARKGTIYHGAKLLVASMETKLRTIGAPAERTGPEVICQSPRNHHPTVKSTHFLKTVTQHKGVAVCDYCKEAGRWAEDKRAADPRPSRGVIKSGQALIWQACEAEISIGKKNQFLTRRVRVVAETVKWKRFEQVPSSGTRKQTYFYEAGQRTITWGNKIQKCLAFSFEECFIKTHNLWKYPWPVQGAWKGKTFLGGNQ